MRFAILMLLCAPAMAGLWSPSFFAPTTHADGTVTWLLNLDLRDYSKADRALPPEEFNLKAVGPYIAHHKVCPKGWEITSSRTEKRRLILEGRCK